MRRSVLCNSSRSIEKRSHRENGQDCSADNKLPNDFASEAILHKIIKLGI